MIILGVVFILGIQPLLIIISLIGVVLYYSLILYYETGRYWFGYILILVILSGVLVIFTYVIRLFPDEKFELNNLVLILIFFVYLFAYITYLGIGFDSSVMSLKLWEGVIGLFTLYLASFLLGIIVIVIWLRWFKEGALRGGL